MGTERGVGSLGGMMEGKWGAVVEVERRPPHLLGIEAAGVHCLMYRYRKHSQADCLEGWVFCD